MKLEFSKHIFEKSSNIKFHENPSNGSRLVPCGRTDEQTDRLDEANSPFRNFVNAPKRTFLITKNLQRIGNLKKKKYVGGTSFWTKGRSSGLSPPTPSNTLGDARVSEVNWRNQALKAGDIMVCFLLQNLLTASKPPNSTCNWTQCPDATFYQSKPLSQLQNCHCPLLRIRIKLRLRFFNFFMAALLPNVNRMVKRDFLIMGIQQIKYIFDMVCTTDIFSPGSDDMNTEMLGAMGFIKQFI